MMIPIHIVLMIASGCLLAFAMMLGKVLQYKQKLEMSEFFRKADNRAHQSELATMVVLHAETETQSRRIYLEALAAVRRKEDELNKSTEVDEPHVGRNVEV